MEQWPISGRKEREVKGNKDSKKKGTLRPWLVDVAVKFSDECRAVAFEKYLKSGSGCAFAKRHLR